MRVVGKLGSTLEKARWSVSVRRSPQTLPHYKKRCTHGRMEDSLRISAIANTLANQCVGGAILSLGRKNRTEPWAQERVGSSTPRPRLKPLAMRRISNQAPCIVLESLRSLLRQPLRARQYLLRWLQYPQLLLRLLQQRLLWQHQRLPPSHQLRH